MNYQWNESIFADVKNAKTLLEEAEFGYELVKPQVEALAPGSKVLEVGAGIGILVSRFAQSFPDLDFLGIEPAGDGFSYDPKIQNHLASSPNAQFAQMGYEDLGADEKYDLIYLVNVFEHLPDWKDFLDVVKQILKPQGTCVILCPNYSFPYESHFKLPIIFNKQVSQSLMKKKIVKFEENQACDGLWNSLNFVKFRHVKKHCRNISLDLFVNKKTIEHMIDRLDNDPAFAKRQGLLKIPATIFRVLGLLKLVQKTPVLDAWLPYMHLHISSQNTSNK